MRTFLVSYELAKPALNQPYLADAIMRLGDAWARPLQNVWYLRSLHTEAEIQARLSRLLDDEDGLVIQEAKGEAVLANTGLRWFRRRQHAAVPVDAANVVPFPLPPMGGDVFAVVESPAVRAVG